MVKGIVNIPLCSLHFAILPFSQSTISVFPLAKLSALRLWALNVSRLTGHRRGQE